jgi:hypothetical protein
LSIAAFGFLMAERLIADKPVGSKKNVIERQVPALPKDYVPRGSPARAAYASGEPILILVVAT